MAIVHIPAAMRPTAGGAARVEVAGSNLDEVIDGLEARFPGLRARIVEDGRIRSAMAVFVDGVQVSNDVRNAVKADSEIYLAPAIAGG